MSLRRSPFPADAVVLHLGLTVVLAAAGCVPSEPGGVADATTDATAHEAGGALDAGSVDDDASARDAALADASVDDASIEDATVGTLCGDTWADVAVDVHHCGGCDRDCTLRPGVDASGVACASGACVLACDAHRADCNGDPDDGCEAMLDTTTQCGACDVSCGGTTPVCDTTAQPALCVSGCAPSEARCGDACVDLGSALGDCGFCGNACRSPAHGRALCDEGACAIACDVGYHDCSGACVDDTDVASCGAACAPCATDPHGTTACELGACTLSCAPGYALVAGRCDDIDECASTPGICGAFGTGGTNGHGCTNVDATYTCSCQLGAFAPSAGGVCATSCGDGIQGPGEMCDDGALLSNDGCSSTCRLEMFVGWNCTGTTPTRCSIDWTFDNGNEGFTGTSSDFGFFVWSGTAGAWRANASTTLSDFVLASPARVAPPGTTRAVVVVRHALNFQSSRDGGIVEASIDGGPYVGVDPVAGQSHTHWLDSVSSNPLGHRLAFSGQLASTTSTFHVPVTAGHTFRIRFHVGTDDCGMNQPPNPAWTIENVSVTFAR